MRWVWFIWQESFSKFCWLLHWTSHLPVGVSEFSVLCADALSEPWASSSRAQPAQKIALFILTLQILGRVSVSTRNLMRIASNVNRSTHQVGANCRLMQ